MSVQGLTVEKLIKRIAAKFGDENVKVSVVYASPDDSLAAFTPFVEIVNPTGVNADEANGLIDDLGMQFISTVCDTCLKANVSNWTLPTVEAVKAEAAERKAPTTSA